METTNRGVAMIAAERDLQVVEKGWTAEHDDLHTDGSLAAFAGVMLPADGRTVTMGELLARYAQLPAGGTGAVRLLPRPRGGEA
jgi:hypothetical protein